MVGYNQVKLNVEFNPSTASFENLNNDGKYYLSMLKVNGYQDSEYLQGEGGLIGGEFYVVRKGSLGETTEATENWGWIDTYKAGAWTGGKWHDMITDTDVIPESANDALFQAGEAMWFYCLDTEEDGIEITLEGAGQVGGEVNYVLRWDFNLVGNPNPSELHLYNTSISGYESSEYFQGEGGLIGGEFYCVRMNGLGETTESTENYGWIDTYKAGAWTGGKWHNMITDEDVKPTDKDAIIPVGGAVWMYSTDTEEELEILFQMPDPLAAE